MAEKEYIEREEAKKVLAFDYAYAAAKLLDTVPTADVTEIRRGKWYDGRCTCCGWEMPDRCSYYGYDDEPWERTPYCPNCGAKMDKE